MNQQTLKMLETMLLRILNILTAELEDKSTKATQKSIEIKMDYQSNAKDRYPCESITVTVGEYLARTEMKFKPRGGEERIEKFICADRSEIDSLIKVKKPPDGRVTAKCDVNVDFNRRNEAITFTIQIHGNFLIFYRFIEPTIKLAEFGDSEKSKIWNRRAKIVEMMQSPTKHYKKTDILGFLDDWFSSSGLSMDKNEKKLCFQYIYTNIKFIPEPDNARDMLISYSLLEHNLDTSSAEGKGFPCPFLYGNSC